MVMDSSDDSFMWTNGSSDSDNAITDKKLIDAKPENSETELELKSSKSNKKKKSKREDSSDGGNHCLKNYLEPNHENGTHNSLSNDESYTNLMIKQENMELSEPEIVKSKKKKKHKEKHDIMNVDTVDNAFLVDKSFNNILVDDKDLSIVRKRKKKKKRKSSLRSSSESREVCNEDMTKEIKFKEELIKGLNGNNSYEENIEIASNDQANECCSINENHVKNNLNNCDNVLEAKTIIQEPKSVIQSKKVTKISERLTFEDDDFSNFDQVTKTFDCRNDLESSDEIKNYQNLNKHLTLCKIIDDQFESDDEEEWILNCPSEINISDFQDADLVMDGKNKVKIGGQSYDRTVEIVDSLSLVKYKNRLPVILHMNSVEVHSYCKRIPKPHIPEDGVMVNNQTNFIPLPDTRCRHPLFGSDYKKAIKIPKSIAERLNPNDISMLPKLKKKKHKKERTKVEEDSELETSLKTLETKKKKKRKHSETENTENISKKIKVEKNVAGDWESERAIEENLFNF